MRVIHGTAPRPRSALQAAYDEFRLNQQGELVSPRTLEYYDDRIGQFLDWLAQERPEVRRVGGPGRGDDAGVQGLPQRPCDALGAAASGRRRSRSRTPR